MYVLLHVSFSPLRLGDLLDTVSLSISRFLDLGFQLFFPAGDLLLLEGDLLRTLHNLNLHLLLLDALLCFSHLLGNTGL